MWYTMIDASPLKMPAHKQRVKTAGIGAERPTEVPSKSCPYIHHLNKCTYPPNGTTRKGIMTRDYNKQPRDDMRSFPRNQSPNRAGGERSSRTPRPRLNRETVDRAWESGAPAQHADYRTRSSNGQPSRNGWRNNQQSEHSPAQNGRRPYDNNQGNQRKFERTPNGNYGSRPGSFGAGPNRFDDQRFNSRPGIPRGPQGNGNRGSNRGNQRPYEQRPPYREKGQGRGYQRRDGAGPDRRPRDFEGTNRPPRNYEGRPREIERDNRPPHNFDRKPADIARNGERSQHNAARGNRPHYPAEQRDTHNPRWQSRPPAWQDRTSPEQSLHNEGEPQGPLFEGDYERFDTPVTQRADKPARPYKGGKEPEFSRSEPVERHVTRLPDGRVLKGPRPAQRKNAQFWSEISNETEQLIDRVEAPALPAEEQSGAQPVEFRQEGTLEQASPAEEKARTTKEATPKKPRARTTSATKEATPKKPHAARNGTRSKKTTVEKPRSTGPKPSQRGFKWPTPEG
jgi:hypothetical protein